MFENLSSLFSKNNVHINLNVSEVNIANKMAVYLGILINELCVNSIKHGFKNIDEPRISCEIVVNDDKVVIHYADNGIGIDTNVKLTLIDLLCRQIYANYKFYNNNGFEIVINLML